MGHLESSGLIVASYVWTITSLQLTGYRYSLIGAATVFVPVYYLSRLLYRNSHSASVDAGLSSTALTLIVSVILAIWVPSTSGGSIDPWYSLTHQKWTAFTLASGYTLSRPQFYAVLAVLLVPALITALMLAKKLTTFVLFCAFLFHTSYRALGSKDSNERLISWGLVSIAAWGTLQSFLNLFRDTTLEVMDHDAPDEP